MVHNPLEMVSTSCGVHHHAVFMLDACGRMASWSEGVERVLGWPEQSWIGQPLAAVFSGDECSNKVQTLLQQAAQVGEVTEQATLERPNGEALDAVITCIRQADKAGALTGFVTIVHDETEHNRTQTECERLLEAEREARALAERRAAELDAVIESIPDAVYIGDAQGITRCNERGLEMLGASSIEDLRRPLSELGQRFRVRYAKQDRLVDPDDLPFARAFRGTPSVLETWVTNMATGSEVYVRSTAAPVVIDGRIVSAVAVNSDLTHHWRIEDEHRRLSQLIEHSGDLIAVMTTQGQMLYLNPAGRELVGLENEAAPGSAMDLFFDEDRARVEAEAIPALHRHERWSGEVRLRHRQTRQPIHVLWSVFPVHDDESRHSVLWGCIGHDLTRTKRIETALSERDQQFKALLNGVRDYAIFAVDVDGKIASWHEGAMLMKGYTAEEAIGMPCANLLVPEDRANHRAEMEMRVAATTGEYKGECQRLRKDGTRFDAFVVLTATRGPDGELLGYLKLTQDITERKQREADREELLRSARAAREEAERANKMKNEFLATISHELRTPLGAILGWSRLLERGMHDAQGVKHGLAVISRNASIQSQLIDDLLDMARIESGTLRLDVVPVEVASVVAAAVDATAPAAAARGIAISTEIDPATPAMLADGHRIQQVVWNLLSNSVKFTPNGGSVAVRARPSPFGVEIAVSDTGQGISPSFLPHVFDRFRQHDSSITRRQGGLGLGLSIVKQLVELHGGQVRAESPGEDQGATFIVELPTAMLGTGWNSTQNGLSLQSGGSATGAKTVNRLKGVTVLVVDDETDAREVAMEVLQKAGASVIAAGNAIEGLDALKRHRPDVLLSDIGMPRHDGFEFISWVRRLAKDEGGAVPAAAVTAYAANEDRERALKSGFQVHVAKPVEVERWIETVEELVGRRP